MKKPRLASVMTPFPYFVDATASLEQALSVMQEHQVRHLPVTQGRRPSGMLTEMQLRQELQGSEDAAARSVSSLEPHDTLIVDIATPLEDVAAQLAELHQTAAVVTRDGRVAGVLTAVDLCLLLSRLLREGSVEPDDVA